MGSILRDPEGRHPCPLARRDCSLRHIVGVLGEAVTLEVAEAWDEVSWLMAETLIGAESEMYRAAGVEPGDVFRDAVLRGRRDLSDTVTQFTFAAPEEFVHARAGQYVSIGVVFSDGARQLRQYSQVDWGSGGGASPARLRP